MINPNKIFPRLSIRWKLAIAFVAMAGFPLGIVGVVGTRSALHELRRSALADLEHEVDISAATTASALREIGKHIEFLDSLGVARDVLLRGPNSESAAAFTRIYLQTDSSALFRVKFIGVDGYPVGAVTRGTVTMGFAPDANPEMLYLLAAEDVPRGRLAYLPVELSATGEGSDGTVVPAVAVVRPVFAGDSLSGVVVGEADASSLFRGLELKAPDEPGVTGLVDGEGRYLYHSEFKRDWRSLLEPTAMSLDQEFPPSVVSRILAGESVSGTADPRDLEIAVRVISPGDNSLGTLRLYRTVPMAALFARVGRFLLMITLVGGTLVAALSLLAIVAARQITRPITRLQQVAHELAEGGKPALLEVETNDEIEDLAHDFNHMAATLTRHRDDLEALVTERTNALRHTQLQLTQLVTSSADAIVGTDSHDVIILWNRGAEELFGYGQGEALGAVLSDLVSVGEQANEAESRYIRQAMNDKGFLANYRTRRRTKDGSVLPVTLTVTALRDGQGATTGYSIIVRDDRAREMLEDQMRRSERLAAISIMAGGLAHELNNPLSVLGNRIELMQREATARKCDEYFLRDLDVLRKHVGRIGAITGDLLRFARDDEDDMAGVRVNDVIDRVVRLTHRVFVAADLELGTQLPANLPPALGNDSIVETILVNLLLNAKHATPRGGKVEVLTRTGPASTVEIEVRDTGPGVPPELRRRIFEPFFTTRAKEGGTGLGLAVCRALVDRMGGTLDVTNWSGGGASFVVRLPQDAQAAA